MVGDEDIEFSEYELNIELLSQASTYSLLSDLHKSNDLTVVL